MLAVAKTPRTELKIKGEISSPLLKLLKKEFGSLLTIKQTDESTVYILTNKKTNEVFQFASRSLAFPPGI